MSAVITRFAPSPTGLLHIGNVRTALVSWLYARKHGGQFILRLDDTDTERSTEAYADAIRRDLEWLGLTWDREERQSHRLDRYDEVKKQLIAAGRLYPCFETKEELEIKRKMLLSRGLPPVYDRASLALSAEEITERSITHTPHYRFKMQDGLITWHDLIKGPLQYEAKHISDPILIREDQRMTYMLCSVVDDSDMHITHIIRGDDHVTNTAIQMQIFDAIGSTPPACGHLALMHSPDKEMSKRTGGFDIQSLRESGIHPMALLSYLSKIGTSQAITPTLSYDEIIAAFDNQSFSKSPTTYMEDELHTINHKIISQLSWQQAEPVLALLGLACDALLWNAIKHNMTFLTDATEWWRICREPVTPIIDDAPLLEVAAGCFPQGALSEESWNEWIRAITAAIDRKGKSLFMPLRRALTGQDNGPELRVLLPLIGRERALQRLKGTRA